MIIAFQAQRAKERAGKAINEIENHNIIAF